jgi:ATP-binding cassette subfamily B (MDR/TAP) protein 9
MRPQFLRLFTSQVVSKVASTSTAASKQSNATISELLLLSKPDAVFNSIALTAGCVAALCTALVPYYTGLVIDYASIEPDRWITYQKLDM